MVDKILQSASKSRTNTGGKILEHERDELQEELEQEEAEEEKRIREEEAEPERKERSDQVAKLASRARKDTTIDQHRKYAKQIVKYVGFAALERLLRADTRFMNKEYGTNLPIDPQDLRKAQRRDFWTQDSPEQFGAFVAKKVCLLSSLAVP